MLTNKKCAECGFNLEFNAESQGRELTCNKCGAVYEFRNFTDCQATHKIPVNLNPRAPGSSVPVPIVIPVTKIKKEEPKLKQEEKKMSKDYGKCSKHPNYTKVSKDKCPKCYAEAKAGTVSSNKTKVRKDRKLKITIPSKPVLAPLGLEKATMDFIRQIKITELKLLVADIQAKINALEKQGE